MDPTPGEVAALMSSMGCDADRAKSLLRRFDNDGAKAEHFLRQQQRYLARPPFSFRSELRLPGSMTPSLSAEEIKELDRERRDTEGNPKSWNFEPKVSSDCLTSEWDFKLPQVGNPGSFSLIPNGGHSGTFEIYDLVNAIQRGVSLETLQAYMAVFDKDDVKRGLNETVDGFPSIFYAVATNDELLVRAWISHGAEVSVIHEDSGVPLIAFAIVHSEIIQADTSPILATLLSVGASPDVIPSSFYSPYTRDLPQNAAGQSSREDTRDVTPEIERWCTGKTRAKLAKTATLTHRYYLDKASKTKKPTVRERDVAQRRKAEPLLGIPYFLVGQTVASKQLLTKLLSHFVIPSKRPLVLVFAGPSGHGKTELARRMGHLLGLDLEVVDCTIMHRETELFGPRHPYIGADRGSPLNNFIAANAGRRCIVFLDEFEKTTSEIHKTLLVPFENGEYQDRRTLGKIDCSKIIWILATNALDDTIKAFCNNHEQIHSEDVSIQNPLVKDLTRQLKDGFRQRFDSPLTSRISGFIPFLPFSSGEQAVVAHKYLLELAQQVRQPVRLSSNSNGEVNEEEQFLGGILLRIRHDASVCRALAEQGYDAHMGARSLRTAVDTVVKEALVEAYLGEEEEIKEGKVGEELREVIVDVAQGEIAVTYTPKPRRGYW